MTAQRKISTARGKVLSFIRANGEWMAVVASFSNEPNSPVLSHLVRVVELKGSARRKADRWVEYLS
jgi:hypothetical protein